MSIGRCIPVDLLAFDGVSPLRLHASIRHSLGHSPIVRTSRAFGAFGFALHTRLMVAAAAGPSFVSGRFNELFCFSEGNYLPVE
jgi:hypothetical protein